MTINKILIAIAILVCVMFTVIANTEPPTQLKEGELSELIGYGYFTPPLPNNPEYVPYNDYFYEGDE